MIAEIRSFVAEVERYIEEEVQEHYLMLKSRYINPWDKVFTQK